MYHTALRPAPDATADLAATLVDRILNVQRQYKRETGRKLDYELAFLEVIRRADAGEPVDGDAELTREDLLLVAIELASRGYSREMIDAALADIMRCGSAQSSSHIDESDRDDVEGLIPGEPQMWGPEADADCWEPGSII